MKKKLFILLLVAIGLFTLCLAGCDNGGGSGGGITPGGNTAGEGETTVITKDILKDCYTSFQNAVSLGIVNKDLKEEEVNPSEETPIEKPIEKKTKNFLVTFDADNNISDVVFFRKAEGAEDDEVRQEEIKGQVDKVFVANEFTFIRFAAMGKEQNGRDSDKNFDAKDYICNDDYQSFAINNASGKVYPFDGLETVSEVGACYVVCGGIYYKPEINPESGNLKLEPYVSNNKVKVLGITQDKFGTVFVRTDKTDEVVGNVIYYTEINYSDPHYMLGDDGRMYVVSETDTTFLDQNIRVYGSDGRLAAVGDDLCVYLSNSVISDSFLIKGEILYCLGSGIGVSYKVKGTDTFDWCDGFYDFSSIAAGGEIYGIGEDGRLFHVKAERISSYEVNLIKTPLSDDKINGTEVVGNYLITVTESVNGTIRHKVYMKNGVPVYELFDQNLYSPDILTIKPLN